LFSDRWSVGKTKNFCRNSHPDYREFSFTSLFGKATYFCIFLAFINHFQAIDRARNKEISFADAATVVFESIAGLVDKSQPFVETYYGPGQLKSMVFQLQKECDKQAINVLQAFDMDRGFTTTSQKVMKSKRGDVGSLSLDAVLTETARLSERGEMYFRFLRRRLATDLESVSKVRKRYFPIILF